MNLSIQEQHFNPSRERNQKKQSKSRNDIKNILFIQPFVLHPEHLTDEILIWEVYLENFLHEKLPKLNFELIYLPVEKDRGRIRIESFTQKEQFFEEMDRLVYELSISLEKKTICCISGTTSHHFLSSKLIAEYFQDRYPEMILVFGGAHASASSSDFNYSNSPFDYVIQAEGEIPLYKLIKSVPKKRNEPIILDPHPFPDLDQLPILDFKIFNKYLEQGAFNRLSISLSRGCPFNCHFCMEKSLLVNDIKTWRTYTPKRSIKEVKRMIECGNHYGIKDFGFYDPTFGLNKKWLNSFLNGLEFQDSFSHAWIETRLDITTEKLLRKLYKKKFYVMYGLESYDYGMLKIMNKTQNPKRYLEKFESLYKNHLTSEIPFMINLLINHPGETSESLKNTFNRMDTMVRDDKIEPYLIQNIRYYHHFPGTHAYNHFEFYGKRFGASEYLPGWYKNEGDLRFGPYCVKASQNLSLRESFLKYTNRYIEIEKLNLQNIRSLKPTNAVSRAMRGKNAIRNLTKRKDLLFSYLDQKGIETQEESIFNV